MKSLTLPSENPLQPAVFRTHLSGSSRRAAQEFIPERWLSNSSKFRGHSCKCAWNYPKIPRNRGTVIPRQNPRDRSVGAHSPRQSELRRLRSPAEAGETCVFAARSRGHQPSPCFAGPAVEFALRPRRCWTPASRAHTESFPWQTVVPRARPKPRTIDRNPGALRGLAAPAFHTAFVLGVRPP